MSNDATTPSKPATAQAAPIEAPKMVTNAGAAINLAKPRMDVASTKVLKPAKAAAKKSDTKKTPVAANASKIKSENAKKSAPKSASAKSTAKASKKDSGASAAKYSVKSAMKEATARGEKVVSIGKSAMQSVLTADISAIGMDTARQWMAGSADAASRAWGESMAIHQQHMEACAEVCALTADAVNEIAESSMNFANDTLTENVEICKSFFGCRTASDMLALQARLAQTNMERFLSESARSSNLIMKCMSRSAEPFSEVMASTAKRVKKEMKK
jgi:Phasin protein